MDNGTKCSAKIMSEISDVLTAVATIASGNAIGANIDVSKVATDFKYPTCADWY